VCSALGAAAAEYQTDSRPWLGWGRRGGCVRFGGMGGCRGDGEQGCQAKGGKRVGPLGQKLACWRHEYFTWILRAAEGAVW
jgi:hypothetical protein